MRKRLKSFRCWYFRYYGNPHTDELTDGGLQSKGIRAFDFEDAWRRWWDSNPAGDIYRDAYEMENEETGELNSRN